MKNKLAIAIVGLCLWSGAVMAEASKSEEVIKNLQNLLAETFRSAPDSVSESVIPGLYQVLYGTEVVYISADGKYFISGDMINLKTRENLSEVAQRDIRLQMMEGRDLKPMTFKAKDEKHVIKVFTDVDCGYCAKLHREMKEINDKGITVEYLAFPRAGIGSQSYKKIVSAFCADDPKYAMTQAKERRPIDEKTCNNPVQTHYELGQGMGVNGTPALLTSSGQLIPGYVPADRLLAMLDAAKKKDE